MNKLSLIIKEEINRIIKEGRYNFNMRDKYMTDMSFREKINNELFSLGYVIHGSESHFTEFDKNKIRGGNRGVYGYGAYFTDETYKSDEFSVRGNYNFLYLKPFNILDCEKDGSSFHDFDDVKENLDYLNGLLYNTEEKLYNSRNSREYDYYESLITDIKEKISKYDDKFVECAEIYNKYKDEYSIEDTLKFTWKYSRILSQEEVSNIFLKLGYDGFKCGGNQYVIFNFSKLNKYLVKDNDLLISHAYEILNNK